MKLVTKKIEECIPPLYANEQIKIQDQKVYVKFFTPWTNWTWWATEGEKTEDGDWRFFGVVEGQETETGYFMLSELAEVTGPYGLKIERDIHIKPGGKKIGEVVKI
jgi:hypothetical protein